MRALLLAAWVALVAVRSAPAHAQQQPSSGASLEQAFQKEFAYLEAEKKALIARRAEQQAEARSRVKGADQELSHLEARLLALEKQADDAEARLSELDEAVTDAEGRRDLLDSTMSQAQESLGLDLEGIGSDASRLAAMFSAASTSLEQGRRIVVDEGPFFLPDGTQVSGTRVKVGQVAAYGVSDRGTGALLPLGSGRLQLREQISGVADAKALAAGETPDHVGAFLLESFDQAVTERTDRSALEVVEAGGVVAWVITCLGVLVLLLAGVRALTVLLKRNGRGLAERAVALVEQGDEEQALTLLTSTPAPVLRVLATVLRAPSRDREALQDAASEALLHEIPAIERFASAITVIAAVAPLLGLLGTVTGMIATFEIITEFGTGDPKMLSGGISEALITTELGLIVAIPAVLIGNALKASADELIGAMERIALRLVNLLADADAPEREPAARRPEAHLSGTRRPDDAANIGGPRPRAVG